jgi:ABC-2 type transport system ATP-binding protein
VRVDITAALSVDAVVVRYGDTTAVDGASFTLPRGRISALLGRNGAGKTSLLRVCEGFRRPDGGRVAVLGVDPHAARDRLMPRLGIMAQGGGVHPTARAGQMLHLFASYAANPLDPWLLVRRLGLHGVLDTPCRRLSGGERQRLALALALVGRPELVFLDEPTAGMDIQARHATWDLIEDLRADGVSVLLTTHLLDEAERLADDVVIIDRGQIVATGSPAQLTATAGIERLHLDANPAIPLSDLARLLPHGCAATESTPGRYTVAGTLDAAAVAAAIGWFAARGARVTAVHSQRMTLEDTFLALTDRSARR